MNTGRIIGGLIIVAFLVTMITLVRREADHELPSLDAGEGTLFSAVTTAAKWQDIDEWMLIQRHDVESGQSVSIGAAHTSVVQLDHPTTAAAYRAQFNMEGKISPLLPRVFVRGAAVLDRDANLSNFTASADGIGLSLSAQGEVRDNILYLQIQKPNGSSYSRRKLSQPVSLSEALRPSLSRHMEIKPGAKMSSPVIDPLTGQSRGKLTVSVEKAETIDVGGKTVEAYRVKTSVGDIDTLMWVDADGRTLRRNLVSGIFMEKTTTEQALKIAPSLDQDVEVPTLDLKLFEGVPIEGITSPDAADDASKDSTGSSLLQAILG